MELPSPWLLFSIFIHGIFGSFSEAQLTFTFQYLTPLSHFYNESLYSHYGIILDSNGVTTLASFINNLIMIASILGTLIILPKMDIKGRKYVSVYCRSIAGLIVGLAVILGYYLNSFEIFAIGMFFIGFQTPMKIGVLKMYISECSPDSVRGFTIHALTSMAVIGALGPSLLAMESILGNDQRWHYIGIVFIFWSLLYLVLASRIPESPKFMRIKNYPIENVKSVIKKYHGKNVDLDDTLDEYDREFKMTNEERTSIVEVIKDPGLRDSLWIAIVASMASSLSPNQLMNVDGVTLKMRFGLSNADVLKFDSIIGIIMSPISFLLPYLIEKFGRRPLLFMAIGLNIIVTILLFLGQLLIDMTGSPNSITVVFAYLLNICNLLSIRLGIAVFFVIIIADILPTSAKGSTTQITIIINSVLNMVTTTLYAIFDPIFNSSVYLPIFMIQVFCFIYLFRNFDETKQKSVFENFAQVRSRAHSRIDQKMRSRLQTTQSIKNIKYGSINSNQYYNNLKNNI